MVKKCSEKTEGRPQAASRSVFCIRLCAEVRRTHRVVAQQLLAAACQRDASGLEHVADVGDLERHVRVLLDEQNGHPAC